MVLLPRTPIRDIVFSASGPIYKVGRCFLEPLNCVGGSLPTFDSLHRSRYGVLRSGKAQILS